MDKGRNFKYKRCIFKQHVEATDGHGKQSIKDIYIIYHITKVIDNIEVAWNGLTLDCMNRF
uniref:Uncharacterized protein n=1 Tax=Octopus bimaculoides TaxID=37653 RepID=A0A0L8HW37_OCTBM